MIENYLVQLKESNSEIYIHGIGHIINEILLRIKPKISFSKLAEKLNVHKSLIYKWKKDTPISIRNLYRLCDQIRDFSYFNKIYGNNNGFSSRNSKPINLPIKLTVPLSYLVGLILGDGCITFKKGTLLISSSHSEVKRAKKILMDIFNINCKFKSIDNYYLLEITSVPLKEFLNRVFDIPLGKKKDRIRVSKLIFKSNNENKIAFIYGFFNSDGSLSVRKDGRMTFAIKQSTRAILEDISIMLDSLNIKAKIYQDRTMNSWSINIFKREQINKIIELFDRCAASLMVSNI